jgi:hypothetical protein
VRGFAELTLSQLARWHTRDKCETSFLGKDSSVANAGHDRVRGLSSPSSTPWEPGRNLAFNKSIHFNKISRPNSLYCHSSSKIYEVENFFTRSITVSGTTSGGQFSLLDGMHAIPGHSEALFTSKHDYSLFSYIFHNENIKWSNFSHHPACITRITGTINHESHISPFIDIGGRSRGC